MFPSNPRAVVTGAGSGLGRAFSRELARRGARLILADIDESGARETSALLGGAESHVVRCDVAKPAEVAALADRADELFGGTDIVINNAGVAVGGPMGDVRLEDWEWIFGINLWGVIYGCHTFIPRMKKQGGGHVLNVASAAGLLCTPQMAPYNVTKAGVVALSETLASECAEHGIKVSVLCPTFFRTNIMNASRTARSEEEDKLKDAVNQLMDRAKIQADDVARIALDGLEAGELHIVPHADGRWLWRAKRVAPDGFHSLLPKLLAYRMKRAGVRPPK